MSGGQAFRAGFWTVLGFGGSQVLRFGFNLITTRLLYPELFGVMGLAMTLVTGLTLCAAQQILQWHGVIVAGLARVGGLRSWAGARRRCGPARGSLCRPHPWIPLTFMVGLTVLPEITGFTRGAFAFLLPAQIP